MKKLLLSALVMLMAVGANAQIVVSQSNIVTKTKIKKEKNTTWYMRLGVQTSTFAFDEDFDDLLEDNEFDKQSTAGYNLEFGFQKPIRDKGAYWGMTFGLGSRGYKLSTSDQGSYDDYSYKYEASEKTLAHNLQYSPFTFGWKIKLANKLYLDPHVGVYISGDFAGKTTAKSEVKIAGETEKDSESYSIYDDEQGFDWCPIDAGINGGIGIWYDRFNFDITYQRGLVNVFYDDDMYDEHKSKASNLMFRLGVAF